MLELLEFLLDWIIWVSSISLHHGIVTFIKMSYLFQSSWKSSMIDKLSLVLEFQIKMKYQLWFEYFYNLCKMIFIIFIFIDYRDPPVYFLDKIKLRGWISIDMTYEIRCFLFFHNKSDFLFHYKNWIKNGHAQKI